jgi:hypothetical protein
MLCEGGRKRGIGKYCMVLMDVEQAVIKYQYVNTTATLMDG